MKLQRIQLIEKLRELKGATFTTIRYVTTAAMNKTNNPYYGTVKECLINGQINVNYEAAVKKLREKREVEGDWEVKERKWGKRIYGTPLVEHKGLYYVECRVLKVLERAFFFNDSPIEIALIQPFLKKHDTLPYQGISDGVHLRDIGVNSIVEIRLNGINYSLRGVQ